MVSQSQCSFLVFQDAGYGEKSLFSCDDDNDDSESKNIDDEVTNTFIRVAFLDDVVKINEELLYLTNAWFKISW